MQLRKEILEYLVSELRLLYPEHLDVLLDQDIDALDFSGLATVEHRSKLKETHLQIVGAKCPRLKSIDLTGAVKLSSKGFAEGISKCHQVQYHCSTLFPTQIISNSIAPSCNALSPMTVLDSMMTPCLLSWRAAPSLFTFPLDAVKR